MAKLKITWKEFIEDIRLLQKKIEPIQWKLTGIYGIPRGGLAVAVLLSHKTGLPIIMDKKKITSKTLIVDDIADSGKTLQKLLRSIKKKRKDVIIATVWYYPASKINPDYYIKIKENNWIIFPWETLLSSKVDNTKI